MTPQERDLILGLFQRKPPPEGDIDGEARGDRRAGGGSRWLLSVGPDGAGAGSALKGASADRQSEAAG
jgi:hypothetical protein